MFNLSRKKSLHLLVFIVLSFNVLNLNAQNPEQSVSSGNFLLSEKKKNIRQDEDIENREAKLKAIEGYQKTILVKPNNAVLYNNLGAALFELKKYDEAILNIKKAIEINPKLANAYYNLSVIYEYQNRFPEALAEIEKAVLLNGNDINIRIEKCQILLALKNFKEAVPCHEILFQMKTPNARDNTNYGLALLYAGHSDKADSVLTENIKLFPNESITHNALGMSLFLKKKYKQALPYFSRAVELNPKFEAGRYNLAISHLVAKDRDSALKQYAFLKNSNSDFAAQLYKYLFSGSVVYANK